MKSRRLVRPIPNQKSTFSQAPTPPASAAGGVSFLALPALAPARPHGKLCCMNTATIHPLVHMPDGHVRHTFPVTADVAGLRVLIVNLYFVGDPAAVNGGWVLIDAG